GVISVHDEVADALASDVAWGVK
ncbi:hypothetical protein A2U01_0087144, partial [Trifolium medium]|nr:hypothetical protein [Trifolium medium]